MKRPRLRPEEASSGDAGAILSLKVPLPLSFQALSLNEYRLAREEKIESSPPSPVSTVLCQLCCPLIGNCAYHLGVETVHLPPLSLRLSCSLPLPQLHFHSSHLRLDHALGSRWAGGHRC